VDDCLQIIWERADIEEPRFSGDEASKWDSSVAAGLIRAGLLRLADNATTVVCDACEDGHVEEVVYIRSPRGTSSRAYIHCPQNGRVEVPLQRLKQWVINFEGLAAAIATGLDLAGAVEEIVAGHTWFLGKATIAGRVREFFLARGLTWIDAEKTLGESARLNAASAAVVFVPGKVPADKVWRGARPAAVPLGVIARLKGARLSIDRVHLEGLLLVGKRKTKITPTVSFPTPAGTIWKDVWITMFESEIKVQARGRSRSYTFQEAGFEEKRRGNIPDMVWKVLEGFAKRGGILLPNDQILSREMRTSVRQYVSILRQRLQAFIPNIEGDPVPFDKFHRCYKVAFQISTLETIQFPTPGGTTWADVSIIEVKPAEICILVKSTERFAAPTYDEEGDDFDSQEVAEQETEVERTYHLETLGLTDEEGRPNRRGIALLALLQNGGTIQRCENDKAMLELGGVLRKLMDLDAPAFKFDRSHEKWVAKFDASSKVIPSR